MDNKERRIDNLFPTPILLTSVDLALCESAANRSNTLIKSTPALYNILQDTGGATTEDDLHLHPEFAELIQEINKEVNVYAEAYLGLKPSSVKMTCMWANIQADGFRHQQHQHPNSYISGVLYLRVPNVEKKGTIFFMDPRPAKNMQHGDFVFESGLSYRDYQYVPQTGLMLLFPSWLEHGTHMFKAENGEERIVISFNCVLTATDLHSYKLA